MEEYYDIAPTIVKRIGKHPDREGIYRQVYEDYLLPCIRQIEAQDYQACEDGYRQMVLELKERFMN